MNSHQFTMSIVVPTLNEVNNVTALVERLHQNVAPVCAAYEIVFIDDHSTDGTVEKIKELAQTYPITVELKQGKRGKSYSIIQGVNAAKYDVVCMIDADLQYPPEAIVDMIKLVEQYDADVVLSRRVEHETNFMRRLSSKVYNLIFTRLLFGINYDTQSGLKIFRKTVFQSMTLTPSPWSFDLEFIVKSLLRHYKILSYDIQFAGRQSGEAKVNLVHTTLELSKASVKLRMKVSKKQVKAAYKRNVKYANQAGNTKAFSFLFVSITGIAATLILGAIA